MAESPSFNFLLMFSQKQIKNQLPFAMLSIKKKKNNQVFSCCISLFVCTILQSFIFPGERMSYVLSDVRLKKIPQGT